MQEFIAYAKARPGKLSYDTFGARQIPYWSVCLFNSMARIDALEVAYKSLTDAMLDVIAGRLDYYFPAVFTAVPYKHKARVMAVTSRARSDVISEIPTLMESGLPEYEMLAWRSIMGPAGMKREIVEVLNAAMVKSLAWLRPTCVRNWRKSAGPPPPARQKNCGNAIRSGARFSARLPRTRG